MIKRINLITEPEDAGKEKATKYRDISPLIKEKQVELFSGLGKLDRECTIEIQDDATPFSYSTPRRISLPLQKKVEEELKQLQNDDIITEVHVPTYWCAPIVAVLKDNGGVRICVNLRKLNESVRRENFLLPTTDQQFAQLSWSMVFTKLDCNKGFRQTSCTKVVRAYNL
ncbi:Pol polyprotein [Elysia marginata]|uniref:Pol polyprotein n=1 Tax=Elysia marginata TaxID=1093978 RepID=A0AAV4HVF1_9GAST|nr:Pol polyprotein [Elysia marginata]